MAELLLTWLNDELKVSAKPVTLIEKDFSNGYLFAGLLRQLGVKKGLDDFVDSNDITVKRSNFGKLYPLLKQMNLPVTPDMLTCVMQEDRGVALRLLYMLRKTTKTAVPEVPRVTQQKLPPPDTGFSTHDATFYGRAIAGHGSLKVDRNLKYELLLRQFEDERTTTEIKAVEADIRDGQEILQNRDQRRYEERELLQRNQEYLEEWQAQGWRDHTANQITKLDREKRDLKFEQETMARRTKQRTRVREKHEDELSSGIQWFDRNLQRIGIDTTMHGGRSKPDFPDVQNGEELEDCLRERFALETEKLALEVVRRMPKIRQNKQAGDLARRERERRRRKVVVEQQLTQVLVDQRKVQEEQLQEYRREAQEHREKALKRYQEQQRQRALTKQREQKAKLAADRHLAKTQQIASVQRRELFTAASWGRMTRLLCKRRFKTYKKVQETVKWKQKAALVDPILELLLRLSLSAVEKRSAHQPISPDLWRSWQQDFVDGVPLPLEEDSKQRAVNLDGEKDALDTKAIQQYWQGWVQREDAPGQVERYAQELLQSYQEVNNQPPAKNPEDVVMPPPRLRTDLTVRNQLVGAAVHTLWDSHLAPVLPTCTKPALAKGSKVPRRLLLCGGPRTGKATVARELAEKWELPCVVLDECLKTCLKFCDWPPHEEDPKAKKGKKEEKPPSPVPETPAEEQQKKFGEKLLEYVQAEPPRAVPALLAAEVLQHFLAPPPGQLPAFVLVAPPPQVLVELFAMADNLPVWRRPRSVKPPGASLIVAPVVKSVWQAPNGGGPERDVGFDVVLDLHVEAETVLLRSLGKKKDEDGEVVAGEPAHHRDAVWVEGMAHGSPVEELCAEDQRQQQIMQLFMQGFPTEQLLCKMQSVDAECALEEIGERALEAAEDLHEMQKPEESEEEHEEEEEAPEPEQQEEEPPPEEEEHEDEWSDDEDYSDSWYGSEEGSQRLNSKESGQLAPSQPEGLTDAEKEMIAARRGSRRYSRGSSLSGRTRVWTGEESDPEGGVRDAIAGLPEHKRKRLLDLWTACEKDYSLGVHKLTLMHKSHVEGLSREASELQLTFLRALNAEPSVEPLVEFVRQYHEDRKGRPDEDGLLEELEEVSDQLWTQADNFRGEMAQERERLMQSGWSAHHGETIVIECRQLVQLELQRYAKTSELLVRALEEYLADPMLQLVAHLHRIATGIHGQVSLLQQLADLPLEQVFRHARAVTRETWGTIVDSPAGRCLKQAILGERALLLYRLAMLEEWAAAERAHVDAVAAEIWAKLDTWVGVRVNGENRAIHAVVDPVRAAICALEPADAGQLDPALFQVSEEEVTHFPPRKHVEEDRSGTPPDASSGWTPAMLEGLRLALVPCGVEAPADDVLGVLGGLAAKCEAGHAVLPPPYPHHWAQVAHAVQAVQDPVTECVDVVALQLALALGPLADAELAALRGKLEGLVPVPPPSVEDGEEPPEHEPQVSADAALSLEQVESLGLVPPPLAPWLFAVLGTRGDVTPRKLFAYVCPCPEPLRTLERLVYCLGPPARPPTPAEGESPPVLPLPESLSLEEVAGVLNLSSVRFPNVPDVDLSPLLSDGGIHLDFHEPAWQEVLTDPKVRHHLVDRRYAPNFEVAIARSDSKRAASPVRQRGASLAGSR